MAVVQEMCARIALVTGRGLAANIRLHFPRKMLYGSTGLLFFLPMRLILVQTWYDGCCGKLLIPQMPFAFGVIFLRYFHLCYKFYSIQ